ncbi:MAG: hypothetical protein ACP5RE_03465 [Candidatus Acidifodinimicrobium sp.]
MPQQSEEENMIPGYFNLVALRLDVVNKLADEQEKVRKLKKQLKDIDDQMHQKGSDIVKIVKERGELTGKITLDDFFE